MAKIKKAMKGGSKVVKGSKAKGNETDGERQMRLELERLREEEARRAKETLRKRMLKERMAQEEKYSRINRLKILNQWRKLMRLVKVRRIGRTARAGAARLGRAQFLAQTARARGVRWSDPGRPGGSSHRQPPLPPLAAAPATAAWSDGAWPLPCGRRRDASTGACAHPLRWRICGRRLKSSRRTTSARLTGRTPSSRSRRVEYRVVE